MLHYVVIYLLFKDMYIDIGKLEILIEKFYVIIRVVNKAYTRKWLDL